MQNVHKNPQSCILKYYNIYYLKKLYYFYGFIDNFYCFLYLFSLFVLRVMLG